VAPTDVKMTRLLHSGVEQFASGRANQENPEFDKALSTPKQRLYTPSAAVMSVFDHASIPVKEVYVSLKADSLFLV